MGASAPSSSIPPPLPPSVQLPFPLIPSGKKTIPRGHMQNIISGKAYVVGDNLDTDQIIPAQYLSYNPSIPEERKYFGMYAMSSVPDGQAGLPDGHLRFVQPNEYKSDYQIVVGGKN